MNVYSPDHLRRMAAVATAFQTAADLIYDSLKHDYDPDNPNLRQPMDPSDVVAPGFVVSRKERYDVCTGASTLRSVVSRINDEIAEQEIRNREAAVSGEPVTVENAMLVGYWRPKVPAEYAFHLTCPAQVVKYQDMDGIHTYDHTKCTLVYRGSL